MRRSSNAVWHETLLDMKDRERQQGHKSCVVWLTGFSGSGKSTIAHAVEEKLFKSGKKTYVLDGDNIRHGLNKDLGFTEDERSENIRRIGELTKLFVDAGIIIFTAFISPFKKDRDTVRELLGEGKFIEIYVKCPIKECEKRDPKGWYEKARKGEISNYTGVSAPYEAPENPELVIETDKMDVNKSVETIMEYLKKAKII